MQLALLQGEVAELLQSGGELFWLWFAAGGFILATIYFLYLAITGGPEHRHHYLAGTFIVLWAGLWYVLMASGSGITLVEVPEGESRIFYFGRYIDWVITTPLLLLTLVWVGLGGRIGEHGRMVAYLLGADVLMILTGWLAGSIGGGSRWFWFIVSSIFFAVVLYLLWGWLRSAAREGNPEGGFGLFYTLAVMLTVLWILYPVVWILGTEGASIFSAGVEVFFYAVLDVLAKIGFGIILLHGVREAGGQSRTASQRPSRVS